MSFFLLLSESPLYRLTYTWSFLFLTRNVSGFTLTQRPKSMTLCKLIPVCRSDLATFIPHLSPISFCSEFLLPAVVRGLCLPFPWECASSTPLWPGIHPRVLQKETQMSPHWGSCPCPFRERKPCLLLGSHNLCTNLHFATYPINTPKSLFFTFIHLLIKKIIWDKIEITYYGDFPGSPVVKIPHFQGGVGAGGAGLIPWSGTKIHMPHGVANK